MGQTPLRITTSTGLTDHEAAERLESYGRNSLPPPPTTPVIRRVLLAIRDPLVLVLLAALVLTIATGDLTNTAVVALVVIVNTVLGVRQEISAEQAVLALSQLAAPTARTLRDGSERHEPVDALVPGDLLVLRQGDLVPADAVLVDGVSVAVDESSLTGEAVAVDKVPMSDPGTDLGADHHATGQPDTTGMPVAARLLAGTVVVRGHGLARVSATGQHSALGRIASMLAGPSRATPLQHRMTQLSAVLAVAAVGLSALVMGMGLLRGASLELMLLTGVSLAVAAVPESLPLVVTVSLALAARRMATRHAVVRNLAAVETLGSVTLLATDKTGTLTEARMTAVEQWLPEGADPTELVTSLVLCSDAVVGRDGSGILGDPTETALLRWAIEHGVDPGAVTAALPRTAEVPFDSVRKRMTTVHHAQGGGWVVLSKGAPGAFLNTGVLSDGEPVLAAAHTRGEEMALAGHRVIAVARGTSATAVEDPAAVTGLRLIGLVALADPPKASAAGTVAELSGAGIEVALITGDHPATAAAIADRVGIGAGVPAISMPYPASPDDLDLASTHRVIARAAPSDKFELVSRWQLGGEVVAMIGDGVNDGPALRRADIGVAMGSRGTEVARQAADLVLADDNLETLVAAVREGRRVYANIRRFLLYGLSGGAAEILLMLAGPFAGIPLPLLPAQILWVNLLTHSFAGAALGAQEVESGTMTRPPRPPDQGVLAGGLAWRILAISAVLAAASLGAALLLGGGLGPSTALLTLGAGQLAVAAALHARGRHASGLARWTAPLPVSLLVAAVLLAASVTVPPLRVLLDTVAVPGSAWALAAVTALLAYVLTVVLRPRVF